MRIEDVKIGGKYAIKEGRVNMCGALRSTVNETGVECAYIVVANIEDGQIYYTGYSSGGCKVASCYCCIGAHDLEPYTLFNEGDVILSKYEDEYTVEEVTPKGYYILKDDDGEITGWTEYELRREPFVLKEVEEVVEMTVAQVEKALGHAVKIVKGDE